MCAQKRFANFEICWLSALKKTFDMDSFDVYTLAKIYFEYKKKKDKKVVEV